MAHASLKEMFDQYARMTVKSGQNFDGIGGENTIMDISEFSRWAHEYGMVPKYISMDKMKQLFREANVGDQADDFKHTFDFDEFASCVQIMVNEVLVACGDGAVPAKIARLRTILAGEDPATAKDMTVANSPAQLSANLMQAYDDNNASDGVRVPVSTLWSSVREVESHLQTEEQLRAALDRLAAQAKSEVSQLERQKAAAVAALEASEDQLLELEREANEQLDELQLARDASKAESAAEKAKCDKLREDFERRIKDMQDANDKAQEDKDAALMQRDEMQRLLESGNEERDYAYGDARTMAKERDDLILQHKLDEANWQKELSALDRRMTESIAELEKQMATERTEAEIRLRKMEDKYLDEKATMEKKHSEQTKAAEDLRRKQVAELESQLLDQQRKAETAAREAAQKFRDAEADWNEKQRQLNQELEASKAATRSVEGELSRTQRTMEDMKMRLGNDIQRLHSELQTEIERRETTASELAKLKEEFNQERTSLQTTIDTAQRRVQAADLEIVSLKGEIDSLTQERAGLQDRLQTAIHESERLYRELENEKQTVKYKEVEITGLQGMHEQTKKDFDLHVKTAERQHAAVTEEHHNEQAAHRITHDQKREKESELTQERDTTKRLTEQNSEDRRKHQAEREAQLGETKRRIDAFKKEHQSVEEGLRTELKGTHALHDAARDEINSLKEQLAVSRSREENLQQVRAALDERNLQQQRDIEKKAIKITELEDQIQRLQQQIRSLEQAAEAKAEAHDREIEFLRAEMAQKLKAAEDSAESAKKALTAELTRSKEEAALLRTDNGAANVTIEELRDANSKLRGQLSAEEISHTKTQGEHATVKREKVQVDQDLKKTVMTVEEKAAHVSKLNDKVNQNEQDLRMAALGREQLEAELERSLGEERRLGANLAEEKAHSSSVQQRKEMVDKKLGQTEAVVDTLRVELDSLHMTNDQLAQEARREILGLKDEMNKMKGDYDSEIRRLQEKLAQLQADRDQMESAYQFAKDELMVIKATLAEMEEGEKRTQYIIEDAGPMQAQNPALVNRMQKEWNRNDAVDGGGAVDASPRRKAFARDFRKAQAAPPVALEDPVAPPQKQGKLGVHPWK